MRHLTTADPTNTGWVRDLAETLCDRGTVFADAGDLAAARVDADAAARALDGVRQTAAADRHGARIRSLAYALAGRVWNTRGDAPRARAAWDRALAEIEPVARHSNDYQFLAPLAQALLALGRRDDATPILRKLHAMGYRNSRLVPPRIRAGRAVLRDADRRQTRRTYATDPELGETRMSLSFGAQSTQ